MRPRRSNTSCAGWTHGQSPGYRVRQGQIRPAGGGLLGSGCRGREWSWRSSHPLTSLIAHEFEAFGVVGPRPVVPWHQLPAAIAVTASVGVTYRSKGRAGRRGGEERSGTAKPPPQPWAPKPWRSCSPPPDPGLTFVIEVINVVRTRHGHHLARSSQRPAQDVVPLRQAGAPCAEIGDRGWHTKRDSGSWL